MMATGVPVAIAMAGSALVYILLTGDVPAFVVVHRMISGIDSFPLLAVPFFILAGNLMNNAGITNRIYDFALALVGWLKGGLGHVNVVGSVIFAGMSGTAIADAAGLGTIEIRAMRDHGYAMEFSVVVTASTTTLSQSSTPSPPLRDVVLCPNLFGAATEGAIAACVLARFLGLVWYRTLHWKKLVKVSMDTIETTSAVLFIVAAASIFGWMLTATRATEMIANWVLSVTSGPNTFLL